MKQILISLREQNLPQPRMDVKSVTAKNKSSPSGKLLPEHEEENVFTPKPTLFVSIVISAIKWFLTILLTFKKVRSY